MTARLLVGDVFDRMAELPDASVDLILTSPPFLALRSYLPADHPDKAKEIGSEPTPAAFLDTLLALTAEWRRVLAPHGSICVELGDTYSGTGGATDNRESSLGGNDLAPRPARNGRRSRAVDEAAGLLAPRGRPGPADRDTMPGWPLAKSLCGIPHLYHLSLAYGRNLLTGQESPAGQWRVRNVVAWCRPNPPVGALGDKFRPGTSYMTVACVSGSRYFDLDAVREPVKHPNASHTAGVKEVALHDDQRTNRTLVNNPAGAPPLDWWEIPTQPYAGSHYATWPAALCTRPILAMCPQRVCTTCGEPSRRIVDAQRCLDGEPVENAPAMGDDKARRMQSGEVSNSRWSTERTDRGWSDCGHDTWRPGLVLDPFAGSGTTLAVATGHGRDAIGIDLDPRNAELCRERVGLFLEIDEPEAVA